ncbi:MAG: methyltransferase domain-containing protein [Betaproteobacteria bacterium]|nr:methyltransferase domain-containing protein [Betaproteobacteria bacterium]
MNSAWAASAIPTAEVPTPYLPSTPVAVEEMLRLADVQPSDLVVDLGSGDGRIPITAAVAFGARGYGVDIDPKLVAEANENARNAGVSERVRFEQKDVFQADLREATVVTLYLLTGLVNRLKPKLMKELRPGTRIVAHDFGFSDWTPDRSVNISKNYLLYIVPAAIAGAWRLHAETADGDNSYDVDITQEHQKIRGGARTGGAGFLPLFDAHLEGERIRFVLVDGGHAHHFEGRVLGNFMAGSVRHGIGRSTVTRTWRAERR